MSDPTCVEEWRPIPGYERTYSVSSIGRVMRLPGVECSARIRKLRTNRHGYIDVRLCQNNEYKTITVHKLVMLAFVGPRPQGAEIRHLNGEQTDNRLGNLVYGSASENRLDITRHGRNRNANKTHCSRGHEFTPENTKVIPSRPRGRYCRACMAIYAAERRVTP
jgi:hypothetical protein